MARKPAKKAAPARGRKAAPKAQHRNRGKAPARSKKPNQKALDKLKMARRHIDELTSAVEETGNTKAIEYLADLLGVGVAMALDIVQSETGQEVERPDLDDFDDSDFADEDESDEDEDESDEDEDDFDLDEDEDDEEDDESDEDEDEDFDLDEDEDDESDEEDEDDESDEEDEDDEDFDLDEDDESDEDDEDEDEDEDFDDEEDEDEDEDFDLDDEDEDEDDESDEDDEEDDEDGNPFADLSLAELRKQFKENGIDPASIMADVDATDKEATREHLAEVANAMYEEYEKYAAMSLKKLEKIAAESEVEPNLSRVRAENTKIERFADALSAHSVTQEFATVQKAKPTAKKGGKAKPTARKAPAKKVARKPVRRGKR